MNGENDTSGYSSEEDSRYPPQMALTPIPGSPVPSEDQYHNNPKRPPILPRFSFEVGSFHWYPHWFNSRISSLGRALDSRAGIRGLDSRDQTNTKGLKITEK